MKYLLVIAALTPLSLQAADSVDAQIGAWNRDCKYPIFRNCA